MKSPARSSPAILLSSLTYLAALLALAASTGCYDGPPPRHVVYVEPPPPPAVIIAGPPPPPAVVYVAPRPAPRTVYVVPYRRY